MNVHARTRLLLPLLAIGIMTATAGSVHAQDQRYQSQAPSGTSATLRISFGSSPHWTRISGSQVDEIPMAERPGYDVFRYGGTYYAYDNNRWYSSRRETGDFMMIDDREVPREFAMVPREHWRSYPSNWQDQNPNQGRYQGQQAGGYQPAQGSGFQVEFSRAPHWSHVTGTQVREVHMQDRPSYDLFSYNGNYYVYDNNQWYMSRRWGNEFMPISESAVPLEFNRVPRNHWRNYPAGWDRNGRSGHNGHRHHHDGDNGYDNNRH